MTALTEYLAKKQNCIAYALEFNPDRRPGAPEIRALQNELRQRIQDHRRQTVKNINSQNRIAHRSKRDRDGANRSFLRRLSRIKLDIEQGSPRELFNLWYPARLTNITVLGRGWFCHRVIDARYVDFRRLSPRAKTAQHIRVNLSSWAGDWLARAVIEAGLAPKNSKFNLKIRLNQAYDAKLLTVKRGFKIYSRTLLDAHFDYVIVSPLGMTYHDADRQKLISGLRNKTRSQFAKLSGAIDWVMCKKLGFCSEGISSFCSDFGFDVKKSYSPVSVYSAVKQNINKADQYLPELKILAKSIGFSVPEFS